MYGHHAAIRRARPRAASSTGTGRKNSCNRTASAAKSSVRSYIEAAASILYGGDSQDCLSLQALVSGQEGQNPGSPIESLPFPELDLFPRPSMHT